MRVPQVREAHLGFLVGNHYLHLFCATARRL
jgi:hypothetical protein